MPPQILPILGSSTGGSKSSSSNSSSSKMQSRDHPFNRSTRPLLERRAQPQVVESKKQYIAVFGSTMVPTRGYNDFNLISRQYEALNSTKGYPYGSPPSPTHDFQFSDIARQQHHQRTVHQYTVNSNNSDDEDDYDELVYHHNQLNVGGKGVSAQQQLRRRLLDAASPTPMPPAPPQRTIGLVRHAQQSHRTPPPPPRRTDSPNQTPNAVGPADIDGPFVFGVHHPNTFTPAYDTKVVKDPLPRSPDTSQHGSDTSSSEKSRRALVKEKKNSKRTKSEKKEKPKQNLEKRPSNEKPPPNVKCVLVGDGAVGKTNLILSYIQDRFIHEYVPTAFDKYNVDVSVDGRPICVTLCDTAGQDALDTLRQLCYPGSDVILLCFSVVQPDSFRSLATKWEPEVSKLKGVSLVLVGTQSDLRNDQDTISKLQAQGEKPVPFSSAWDFARKIGTKYIETSSHKKEHIKEVFDTAIWDAMQSQEYHRRKRPLWKRLCCFTC
ncbi:uncharacterized protein LOC128720333 [Anopheles nili]|uniref:uncharacterized protein LOC128720333 n=1 Tax=Anopheles nili TaxID=185578 RepID=UPI00237BCDD0|nr:uncharacterized protein LOC128720333 [Anopheles nili]